MIPNKTHNETNPRTSQGYKEHKIKRSQHFPEPALRNTVFCVLKNWIFPALIKTWHSLHNCKYVNVTNLVNVTETKQHHTVRTSLGIWTLNEMGIFNRNKKEWWRFSNFKLKKIRLQINAIRTKRHNIVLLITSNIGVSIIKNMQSMISIF